MKIEKLILKNFAAVDNAMNTNELTIDFSKSENKICLLIGPNGSGKTTILSLLNPFADVGNLDVRNGNHLILDDKDGYKEIHISKDGSLYIIKHFYTHHSGKSHSVKSYIEKDGKELNPNGNVTSFKEWVSLELNIEPEYLKLIRLGNNVTSLIDLSSTERKNFMSKIMDDIGIYLDYYKSVGVKQRQLNEMISHSVDKLNKLGILDKEGYKKDIKDKEKESKDIHNQLLEVNSKLGILKDQLSKINDLPNLKENLKEIKKKYEKMKTIVEKKDTLKSTDVNYYSKELNDLENLIKQKSTEVDAYQLILQNILKQEDTLKTRKRSIEIQLEKESSLDKEIENLKKSLDNIRSKMTGVSDNLGDFKSNMESDRFLRFMETLKNIQSILNTTYEFGKKPVSKVVELLEKGQNVRKYINGHIQSIDESSNIQNSYILAKLYSLVFTGDNKPIVIQCKEECQAKKVFTQLQNMIESDNPTDKNESIEFYNQMDLVYQNLTNIINRLNELKDTIELLPKDLKKEFELKNFYKIISNLGVIYDEKKYNDLYAFMKEYDTIISLSAEEIKIQQEIERLSNLSNSKSLLKEVEEFNTSIDEFEEEKIKTKQLISEANETRHEAMLTFESYQDIKETLEKFDDVKEKYEELIKDSELVEELSFKISELTQSYERLNIYYNTLQNEIQTLKNNLYQYDELSKELSKMNELYDDLSFIKDSLSSREGMPLYIIQRYLDNTENITNELLDIAYDGKIFLDKFNITPSEFSIPFYNKGVRLEDVKYASQGELSFLSIALSFALATQTLAKYNIMLLDEIDGPLDTDNRAKFIMILENQIERINSEQNFLITHNDMFSSYPVDIVDLGFKNNQDDYPMANFIKVKRG